MAASEVEQLERRAGLQNVLGVASGTRRYLSTPSGLRLAAQLGNHLAAYSATDDLVPYFGDHRLAHTEAYFQLKNAICLAYHGFYSQAFSTLRLVCELTLVQASLPEGPVVSEEKLDLLRSVLPPGSVLPGIEKVNWVLPVGFGARQSPDQKASSLEEWAVDGCRTPSWQEMLRRLLDSNVARSFDSQTQLSLRFEESMRSLDPYVHVRGRLRSGTSLSGGNILQFSQESLSHFGTRMMCAVQVSVAVLLLAFLPSATFHPDASAAFIDLGDLHRALSILPSTDSGLLKAMYDSRKSEDGSA